VHGCWESGMSKIGAKNKVERVGYPRSLYACMDVGNKALARLERKIRLRELVILGACMRAWMLGVRYEQNWSEK